MKIIVADHAMGGLTTSNIPVLKDKMIKYQTSKTFWKLDFFGKNSIL
jgi:hypothetical protein